MQRVSAGSGGGRMPVGADGPARFVAHTQKRRIAGAPTRDSAATAIAGLVLLASSLAGCAYYSFTGASIPAHLTTIAIPLADDNAASPIGTLDEQLTTLLLDRFVGRTRLVLETNEASADAVLTSVIERYSNAPAAVGGEDRAALSRVTISVSVRYFDQQEGEEILSRTFSNSQEYDPQVEGLDGEIAAATTALEYIADDIFTAATSNW